MHLVALSPNFLPPEDRRLYQGKALEYGEASLATALADAGLLPVMPFRASLPLAGLAAWASDIVARVDGLVLSGGQDIGPENYGDTLMDPRWVGDHARDTFEIALYRAALAARKPVLGVCRGAQLIGVAEGGTLWQDLETCAAAGHRLPPGEGGFLLHREQARYDRLTHPLVSTSPFIARLFGDDPLVVNSVHHQALRDVPPSLEVLATAPDGVPECYVRRDAWVLAVQWHPEWMSIGASQRLFLAFAAACAAKGEGDLPW